MRDVAAHVQPPFTDAHGMPMDEPTEREDASFLPPAAGAERQSGSTALSSRPLNRKERRARQRMLERRLRKAKWGECPYSTSASATGSFTVQPSRSWPQTRLRPWLMAACRALRARSRISRRSSPSLASTTPMLIV